MKKYKAILWVCYTCIYLSGSAQMIHGYVRSQDVNSKAIPVPGAVVGVLHTTNSAYSDSTGMFMLMNADAATDTLIVIALGYKTDTVLPEKRNSVIINVQPMELKEVNINANKATRMESSAMNVEVINSNDLTRAACCTLSESFANTASVDVSYSDAVSGARQIRMLGLDGIYTQIMTENIPAIRGLGRTFGMDAIPELWMDAIQVNKGAGSVTNGYESIAGQINIEYKKPQESERLFLNFYLNQDLRSEITLGTAKKINKKWSTLTAIHGTYNWMKVDMNKDGYLDNPLTRDAGILNRFTYLSGGLFNFWSVITANVDDRIGGSVHFNPGESLMNQNYWGLRLTSENVNAFFKTGFNLPKQSFIGIQYNYQFHNQEGYVGRRDYTGQENFGYLNFIYQKTLDKHEDMIKAGASMIADNVNEQFDTLNQKRTEVVPGVFAEGTFNFGADKKVVLITGARLDYSNIYGLMFSPRVNIKWNIVRDLSFRASGGRGYRTPTIFAENFGRLANSRAIVIAPDLHDEVAWNYGAGLVYKFFLNYREGSISVDYYRTDFIHQVVVDMEDTRLLQFYNLQGRSFANALQAEASYEVLKGFDVKLAYKYEPAKETYNGVLKEVPLQPLNRGLASLQYITNNRHWKFNTSLNWFGKTRVPNTSINDADNQRPRQSPNWIQLNAQITFIWKTWQVYAGGENLTNYTQSNPLIAPQQPFSNQFDASLIWGPTRGAMAFVGFRYSLK